MHPNISCILNNSEIPNKLILQRSEGTTTRQIRLRLTSFSLMIHSIVRPVNVVASGVDFNPILQSPVNCPCYLFYYETFLKFVSHIKDAKVIKQNGWFTAAGHICVLEKGNTLRRLRFIFVTQSILTRWSFLLIR